MGRILTVAQQKGGSGKTTLAAHLAVGLHLAGEGPVAILDVDPQGSLGTWYEARENSLGEQETGLLFRTASGWGARREARGMARDHAYVILDTPPKTDIETKPAIESADLVVVPVQPTPVDLWATTSTFQLADRMDVPAVLVLNRVPPRTRLTQDVLKAIADLGYDRIGVTIGNRTGFAASMGEGLTAMETDPHSKGCEEMQSLVTELLGRVARG